MEDNIKNTTKIRLLDGGLHYIFPILMILLLPIPIKPLADKWGYTHYSSMSTLLQGIMLTVLWPLSLILFNVYAKKMKKKGVFTVFNGTDDMISTKSLIAASVIFITMIVLVTFKIGFKVKPFYDFGEKLVGYDVANNIGKLLIKITNAPSYLHLPRSIYPLGMCRSRQNRHSSSRKIHPEQTKPVRTKPPQLQIHPEQTKPVRTKPTDRIQIKPENRKLRRKHIALRNIFHPRSGIRSI